MTQRLFETDEALMTAVASDDEAAIAELYDRFGGLVYRLAYQMMPTRSEAEDAVQDIFVRLWRTAGRYDTTRAALSTWVVLIARRYLVDRLRRARARVKARAAVEEQWLPAAQESEPGSRVVTEERYESLMKKIEQLPELQRTVVTRAYLGGQTLRQIGIELDKPLGTIKSTLSRALVRLRERVGEESVT
ncbi:MAG: sigma-70 family RNA polymerase sigma factor [Planctomycetota bacterium]|nr:MAG: sigma-70 family RNA polymerase sigma factor [Planctomycetota bacterium]